MDIFEVIVQADQLELFFSDPEYQVSIIEDNTELLVEENHDDITIVGDSMDILTIAEQGPPGLFPVHIGPTPPDSPTLGDLWLDTDI